MAITLLLAGRCAALRFYTCGVPIEQGEEDNGGESPAAPASFEAGFSAAKAQVGERDGIHSKSNRDAATSSTAPNIDV